MDRCARRLAEHYDRERNWDRVDEIIVAHPCGQDRKNVENERTVAILATVDGTIVAAGDETRVGQSLSEREMVHATSIRVDDEPVGLLLKYTFDRPGRPPSDWHRSFVAGMAIVGVSLIVALILSRHLSRPLASLTAATRAMTAGDLDVRVPTRYRGEMRELAIAFNRMADQVQETIVTLRRFVSDAAHEIHTPLTALQTNLELAPDDEAVRRALTQVERLEALTAGLLALSRLEANEQAPTHSDVDLAALVGETCEVYAARAEQVEIAFNLTLPETPVNVEGDWGQLQQALGNLLDNAIKFTPKGGTVSVGVGRDAEWVSVWVEDTGIGIPEDDLPHIFDRFHRGRNTAAYPGSGLGLAVVKAIAGAHGGTVLAESTVSGTRFELRVPAVL
jgi:signal transduction histidine kinase